MVHIDGKKHKWADFKKKFEEDMKRNKSVTEKTFTLNRGDINKEKQMRWKRSTNGFSSDDSDCPQVIYNRFEKFEQIKADQEYAANKKDQT